MSKRLFTAFFDEDFKDTARFKNAVVASVPRSFGNAFIKNSTTATTVTEQSARYPIAGTSDVNAVIHDFAHVQADNSLQLTGAAGVFIAQMSFSVKAGNNNKVGVYLGVNKTGTIDATADRISSSEVYVTTEGTAAQDRPVAAAVQALVELDPNDKVYGIVQNTSGTTDITVEFMNLIVTRV